MAFTIQTDLYSIGRGQYGSIAGVRFGQCGQIIISDTLCLAALGICFYVFQDFVEITCSKSLARIRTVIEPKMLAAGTWD